MKNLFLKTPNLKLSGFDLPRTSVICEYEGVHPQTEMYLPSAAEDTPANMPDLRHTLYWNPNVTAKDNHLTFRTSDMRGTYVVKVEGRTKDMAKEQRKMFLCISIHSVIILFVLNYLI